LAGSGIVDASGARKVSEPYLDVFHGSLSPNLVGAGRSITEPEITVFLCDAAESVNGKLYILGAGWSQTLASRPTNMTLAVKLLIPWSRANERFRVRVSLVDYDQEEPVDIGQGPIMAEAEVEAGRLPGMRQGTPLDTSFVFPFQSIVLPQGGYVWKIEVNNREKVRIPIQALSPQMPM